MNAYLDSSVLLRLLLAEPEPESAFLDADRLVTSDLLRVECFRTLDRLRLAGHLTDQELSHRAAVLYEFIPALERVALTEAVLDRALQPFSTSLGTLDAIHLSTAILWRRQEELELVVFTHDRELGLAAQAAGFTVRGVS